MKALLKQYYLLNKRTLHSYRALAFEERSTTGYQNTFNCVKTNHPLEDELL